VHCDTQSIRDAFSTRRIALQAFADMAELNIAQRVDRNILNLSYRSPLSYRINPLEPQLA
jgi:hypothetical protein